MKIKQIFPIVSMLLLILASCSKSEFDGLNNLDPNAIKFETTTSRASIYNLASLEASTDGFKVYATSAYSTTDWYPNIDGTNNYKYSGSAWGWATTNALWPTTTAGYPMNFYAIFPFESMNIFSNPIVGSQTLLAHITIPVDVADQRDFLAAKQTSVMAKPFDGRLPFTFKHILSKVNMGIIAGDGATAYVQYAGVMKVTDANFYDMLAGDWYPGAVVANQSYNYYASAAFPKPVHTAVGTATEDVPVSFYSGNHSNHLMLLPQTTTAWVPANNVLPTIGESYISMIYRLESTQDNIGYADAREYLTDNPGYSDVYGWGSANGTTYTGINVGTTPYGNKPLFVKVGYPLSSTWEMGKGYTYNILLGTAGASNGYLLSGNYVDENGSDTGIPVGKNPGEQISDGIIHFKVAVSDWDNENVSF